MRCHLPFRAPLGTRPPPSFWKFLHPVCHESSHVFFAFLIPLPRPGSLNAPFVSGTFPFLVFHPTRLFFAPFFSFARSPGFLFASRGSPASVRPVVTPYLFFFGFPGFFVYPLERFHAFFFFRIPPPSFFLRQSLLCPYFPPPSFLALSEFTNLKIFPLDSQRVGLFSLFSARTYRMWPSRPKTHASIKMPTPLSLAFYRHLPCRSSSFRGSSRYPYVRLSILFF